MEDNHKPQNLETGQTTPLSLKDRLLVEYGEDFDEPDLSEEQKAEFLLAVWKIMAAFVDLGFEVGPDVDKCDENSPLSRVDVLKLLNLEETAHETVAPRLTHNDEEQS